MNVCHAQTWTDKNEDESYIARHECGFAQVGDKFFLFGGRESPRVVNIYDYSSDSWTTGALAPVDLNHFQAVEYEGLIWVIGAFKTNSPTPEENADYVYMYNPALDQWIQGMEIPSARKRGSSGLTLYNNKFYLVGGNTMGHDGGYVSYFDEFDPQTGTWTVMTDAPRPRDHFQTVVFNNKLYAIGGRLTGGVGGLFEPQVPEVDIYDFNTNSWSTLDIAKNLPHPRSGLAVVLFNGEIFTIAGESTFGSPTNTNAPRDLVQAFNPTTETWSNKASLNYSRHGFQAITSGDGIHITAGYGGGSVMKNMEFYGIDNPIGSPNTSSDFQPDETTKSFTYEENEGTITIDIILSNSLGTTGTYIDNIEITGANFTLVESYNNRFLGANSDLTVSVILNDTTNDESNGTVTVTYNNTSTLNIILDGELDGTLSVQNNELVDNHLILYPSPTKNTFKINKDIASLEIYNLNGKLLKQFQGNFNSDSFFDISELDPNLYIIIARDLNNSTHNSKLLKK
ncbi:Kelch repeat-containing protein [Hanstruepera flava]